ncbi:unnamed protein product [Pleuronectes platessa]|uniref:Uncharacterized protein n=1 Tax=Pleuronectes platessa TaxID=8262 RepID=A0A9N7V9L1_PLEPL|nr:unnamed protein product [Pleuronectes platessa]
MKTDFQKFLQEVTDKFSLQAQLVTEGVLSLTDTSETEVDADTFDELVKSGVRNFKVGYRQPITISSIIARPSSITSSTPDFTAQSSVDLPLRKSVIS